MSEVINSHALLRKIEHIEKKLEDLRTMLLKMVAENLSEGDEIGRETLKAFERDLEDMIEGKVEVLSAGETIKILSEKVGG